MTMETNHLKMYLLLKIMIFQLAMLVKSGVEKKLPSIFYGTNFGREDLGIQHAQEHPLRSLPVPGPLGSWNFDHPRWKAGS